MIPQIKLNKKPTHILALEEMDIPTTVEMDVNIVDIANNINGHGSVKPLPYKAIIYGLAIHTNKAMHEEIATFA